MPKCIHESAISYAGNWKFQFQDVITLLFVQTKKQTNDIDPLEIAMATKPACVFKTRRPVSFEEQILNN